MGCGICNKTSQVADYATTDKQEEFTQEFTEQAKANQSGHSTFKNNSTHFTNNSSFVSQQRNILPQLSLKEDKKSQHDLYRNVNFQNVPELQKIEVGESKQEKTKKEQEQEYEVVKAETERQHQISKQSTIQNDVKSLKEQENQRTIKSIHSSFNIKEIIQSLNSKGKINISYKDIKFQTQKQQGQNSEV